MIQQVGRDKLDKENIVIDGIGLDRLPPLMQQRLEPLIKRAVELYEYEAKSGTTSNWKITIKAEEQKKPFKTTQEFVDFQMDDDQSWSGPIEIESYGFQEGPFEYSVTLSAQEQRNNRAIVSRSNGNADYLFSALNWDFNTLSACEDLGSSSTYGIFRGFRDLTSQASGSLAFPGASEPQGRAQPGALGQQ